MQKYNIINNRRFKSYEQNMNNFGSWFKVETSYYGVSDWFKVQKKQVPTMLPIPVDFTCRHVRFAEMNYRFTNCFVTVPSSVVTRTKYMPSARPETSMRVCRDGVRPVSTTETNFP